MERDFKGIWIPKEVWLNKDLKLIEKIFLVEIDSLDNESGCYASNKYLAEFFSISKGRCSQIINKLQEKGLITIEIIREDKIIISRVIRVVNKLNRVFNNEEKGIKNIKGGYLENDKDNNTIYNNTSNNNIRFQKPKISEIKDYCLERKNNINAESFFDYYESKNWIIGRNSKMKDWKAAVRNWERRQFKKPTMSKLDAQIDAWANAKKLL